MKLLRILGRALAILVMVGFCLLLGILGSCWLTGQTTTDPVAPGSDYDQAIVRGAVVGLVLGIAAAVYYYHRR
jgi:hypothetical protein